MDDTLNALTMQLAERGFVLLKSPNGMGAEWRHPQDEIDAVYRQLVDPADAPISGFFVEHHLETIMAERKDRKLLMILLRLRQVARTGKIPKPTLPQLAAACGMQRQAMQAFITWWQEDHPEDPAWVLMRAYIPHIGGAPSKPYRFTVLLNDVPANPTVQALDRECNQLRLDYHTHTPTTPDLEPDPDADPTATEAYVNHRISAESGDENEVSGKSDGKAYAEHTSDSRFAGKSDGSSGDKNEVSGKSAPKAYAHHRILENVVETEGPCAHGRARPEGHSTTTTTERQQYNGTPETENEAAPPQVTTAAQIVLKDLGAGEDVFDALRSLPDAERLILLFATQILPTRAKWKIPASDGGYDRVAIVIAAVRGAATEPTSSWAKSVRDWKAPAPPKAPANSTPPPIDKTPAEKLLSRLMRGLLTNDQADLQRLCTRPTLRNDGSLQLHADANRLTTARELAAEALAGVRRKTPDFPDVHVLTRQQETTTP